VICLDGSEPGYPLSDGGGYIDRAIENGQMPYLASIKNRGLFRTADATIPSFTNPNNISIVTGTAPVVHGISGNFFYDLGSDAEVMMNDPVFLRVGTIFKAFQDQGARIAIITAKDKLRRMLGHELDFEQGSAICFSAEKCQLTTRSENGIDDAGQLTDLPPPDVYSGALSEYVFSAGLTLLDTWSPDILYLSTSDYIQHKHGPGTPAADAFYGMIARHLLEMQAHDAVIAVTADHGMKAKHDSAGRPNIVYLKPLIEELLPSDRFRIILPITDPYVVHHGALGGFATIYLADPDDVQPVCHKLSAQKGIELVLEAPIACEKFALPPDRVGHIVVISSTEWVLGHSQQYHDLSALSEPLRSHGGLSEQRVPFILNCPAPLLVASTTLRNYDIFDAALNHTTV
jgi:phosphonoacetate hydrolase